MRQMSLRLTIESIAYLGSGVARESGCVYFVPETCPGENVEAEVVREKKTFREARALSVLNPSPDRLQEPNCRIAAAAGGVVRVPGCVYDHVAHGAELRYKQAQLLSFLERQGRIANAAGILAEPFASPKELHYRNKITLRAGADASGRRVLGYFGDDNVTVVDVPQCPLAVAPINAALAEMRSDPGFWRWIGAGGAVVLRWTEADGVVVMSDVEEGVELPPLTERVPVVGEIGVPARGFFQVNPEVGAALVEYVADKVVECGASDLIDFYCGVGVFGLCASKLRVRMVTGFDTGRAAVRMANANARRLGLPARFFCEYSGRVASKALAQMRRPATMAVLDPPRAGLEKEVVSALIAHPPRDVLYVSCSPDTLARDLAMLTGGGTYRVVSARLFDMFPRTAHFETCVHLRCN